MLIPRWLLIATFAMLVGVSGLAVVFAQQQRAPSLSVHAIDFEYDPASPGREARFVAVHDESNGVTCYVMLASVPLMECAR